MGNDRDRHLFIGSLYYYQLKPSSAVTKELAHKGHMIIGVFSVFCIIVGSLLYNRKGIEATVVVIWCNINKTELN